MTVAVTGAAGFIGRALMSRLSQAGIAAVGLTRQTVGERLTRVGDYGEIADGRFAGATLVHLAETSDRAVMARNGAADAALLRDCCRRLAAGPWRHIVYISSSTVYGDESELPRSARAQVQALDLYAEAKLANEAVILAAGGTVLRLANVYGYGMASGVVLSDILAQLEGAGPLTVRDDRPVRDFIHIDDVTAGILAALRHEAGGIFNLGSGKGVSIGDLARLVLAAAGQPARPVVSQHVSARSSHLVLDTAEAATQLGWYPQIPLAEGLHMILPTTP